MQRSHALPCRAHSLLSSVVSVFCAALFGGCGDGPTGEERGPDGAGGEPSEPPLAWVELDCPESTQGFATDVMSFEFGPGQDYGQDAFPENVLGGPQGAGCCQGTLHVTSLGDGGHVVLGFGERTIVDGEGPDFIVFENPFWIGSDPANPLAELGRVAVSEDGEEWREFSCEPTLGPPYDSGCAGFRPVLANVTNGDGPSPWDTENAGGDPYDLADVGLDEARYVRVTDIAGDDVVFDLDAVAVVHGRCD
jgi:hypothetical protein